MGIVDDHHEDAGSRPAREPGTGAPQDIEQIATTSFSGRPEQPR
jgi:hypothetical protein